VQRLTRVILQNGRDVPVRSAGFKALFDEGPRPLLNSCLTWVYGKA
jgi:tRNA-splicing ligase RtcB